MKHILATFFFFFCTTIAWAQQSVFDFEACDTDASAEAAFSADYTLASADYSLAAADYTLASADLSAVSPDSLVDRSCAFRPQQLAFPAVAIALGGAGVKSHLFDTSKERERRFYFDDQIQYVPIVAYAGLGFIPGVKHRHNFGDRLLAGATAYIVMTGVAQGAKHLIREPRPDTGKANSFPSGHTATAFCGAELCRIEYGNAYGAAAYAFAATTGVMRVINNRHWCNDVLAGAGIGFLSAHIGYWLLPWEKRVCQRLFRSRRDVASTPFILAPAYEYGVKAPSLTFAMTF